MCAALTASAVALAPERLGANTTLATSNAGANPDVTPSTGEPSLNYQLRLGEQTFDPRFEAPTLPPGLNATRSDGPDLRLVQLEGPTRDATLDALRDSGLEIVQYIHPYTYIVWGDVDQLDQSRNANQVRWAGEFYPAYRLLPRYQNLASDRIQVHVYAFAGADLNGAALEMSDLADRMTDWVRVDDTLQVASIDIEGDRLSEIASIPGVYSVQPVPTDGGTRGEMSNQICASNYDASNVVFPGYINWLNMIGLDGTGVQMANVDSGVNESHPDLAGRMRSCVGTTCDTTSSSHGTHTAGIMAGDGLPASLTRSASCAASALPLAQPSSPRTTARSSRSRAACCCSSATPMPMEHCSPVTVGVRPAARADTTVTRVRSMSVAVMRMTSRPATRSSRTSFPL